VLIKSFSPCIYSVATDAGTDWLDAVGGATAFVTFTSGKLPVNAENGKSLFFIRSYIFPEYLEIAKLIQILNYIFGYLRYMCSI
jgi:hypothetical protein